MLGEISPMHGVKKAAPGSGQVASDVLLSGHLYKGQACGAGGLVVGKEEGLAIRGACEQHPVCVGGRRGSLKLGS